MSFTQVETVPPAVIGPVGQPDISYTPDFEKYQARTKKRLAEGGLQDTLPAGFPSELKGPLVWEGETLKYTYDWTYVLTEEQLAEVRQALSHFQSLGLSNGHISEETFPLPKLHSELRRLSHELHHGHGFFVLRGIPVDKLSREENIIVYAGLSSHVASIRARQDSKYDGKKADVVLGHIKDLSKTPDGAIIGSPAYTTVKQVFHTDSGDIVSLFALETAAEGGASQLASTWRVYNELAKTRPDLIHTLSKPWDFEVFSKTADKQFRSQPLLFHQKPTETTPERILLQYARRSFVGYGALPRSKTIPPITEAHAEALDALHYLGEKFHVATNFQKGDIQYVNNLAVFHAREGFVDTETKQRHLVRLWLRDPENAWQTPEQLGWKWEQLYDNVTPNSQYFPLEPYVRSESNKAK